MSQVVVGCGVLFELPILSYFLAKVGILTPLFLRTYRKHAFLVILIVAAFITPPDVASQIIVTIPLYLLYELSIVIAKRVERQMKEEEDKEWS
jgi:sec-independent protein translocase protein TatC